MRGLAYFLGLAAGLGLTLQVAMNSQLRKLLRSAYSAALVSFLVGTVGAGARWCWPRAPPLPSRETLAAVPAWAWFGGAVRRLLRGHFHHRRRELGATSLLALALTGQLAMALVVDHFGWLGLPENPITWVRLAGVALLGAGVWLIAR